ncbi:MAG: aldolase/citrate lyase family protein [Gemmatimonadota bacterium]|nr:aldolase/citrate lyase family protein [Gemmatimonadota bacterium]
MPVTQPRTPLCALTTALIAPLAAAIACSAPEQAGDPAMGSAETESAAPNPSAVVELIASGQVVFAVFSGATTPEEGALSEQGEELDLVFHSVESGPFDPLVLRVPPIRDGVEAAGANVAAALDEGVAAIFFPRVESAEEATVAVAAMGDDHWPGNPSGSRFSMLIVETRAGVDRVDEIVGTEGVSVVFAGPDDLRQSYGDDMEAVEAAIQSVLAACQAHQVPCGITASVDDIAERLEQGFRMIIVSDSAALMAGRAAAGS